MVNKGNHPQMAALFRLVKYYNLPRFISLEVGLCFSLWVAVVLMLPAINTMDLNEFNMIQQQTNGYLTNMIDNWGKVVQCGQFAPPESLEMAIDIGL